jgi:hypothetical protein
MKTSTIASEIRILLYPQDFDRSRQFYEQIMQWPVEREWNYGPSKGAMFNTGCGIIELLWPLDETALSAVYNLSLRVADVWSLWPQLADRATVVFPLRENAWGDDSFCIADPDGSHLTFFTDRQSQ